MHIAGQGKAASIHYLGLLPCRLSVAAYAARPCTHIGTHAVCRESAFGSDDEEQPRKRVREDDEFYQAAQAAAADKTKAKKGKYTPADTLPPVADPTVEGPRSITTDIEKNRGLTPHRSKASKNPRVKNRNKFEKAKMRRKGQVQEARPGSAGGYGGEKTGIKSKITRGVRL